MTEEMIAQLKKLAQQKCFCDDKDENVIVDDYAGGNIDDAFDLGERAGETMLAREVLTAMNIEWDE